MTVMKSFHKVIGAKFTANEQKALTIEIRKQLGESVREQEADILATVAYNLMHQEHDPWGKKRIERFLRSFYPMLQELAKHYEMDPCDTVWLCRHKLREAGIDVQKIIEEVK